ncbi:GntT/GntP/DsdX family permease [Williamsia sterculiae]|uniref:GntT/GntP/DsdX family permease n=1 Tax=Williamsia sterculiae TaxID=1344003 RepID=UPI00117FA8F5|nr:gluconate:H+ symporter [Williamsia sterculiae]
MARALAAESTLPAPIASDAVLAVSAVAGIVVIVVLILWLKVHPFISLLLGAALVGLIAGMPLVKTDATPENGKVLLDSISKGFGDTMASVGILVALGAIFAKLLADSGGADRLVATIVDRASRRTLPWAMALVGAVIGLPMFFEIGLVLLMPVICLVAKRAQMSLISIAIPTLAGLSAMHGLVPPHPGPLLAVDYLKADLGTTLMFGVIVAIPTTILAGPLFGRVAARWVDVPTPDRFDRRADDATGSTDKRPGFAVTLATVLLPIVLMMAKAIVDVAIADDTSPVRETFDVIGSPIVALLIATLVAMFTFGVGSGMNAKQISTAAEQSLPGIAGIVLIVAAGGAFKQVLVDTGIGTMLGEVAAKGSIPPVLLAWVLAMLIRVAAGSATIATITASTLMTGVVADLGTTETALVVLAVGAGSLFFSHVNDAGFWLVKEFFGLSVPQTIKSWSLMETVLSVGALVVILLIDLVV